MKAAVVHTLGQPPRYQDFPEPTPNDTEILIQVHAAGLHPIVKARASGAHYSANGQVPMVAGIDGVGTRPDGARVYFGGARAPWGTMAERCAAPLGMCIPLPDGISDLEAAAIANPGMSAWLSLRDRAAVAPGETVLILGATGVAGRLAIQAARLMGAGRIIAAGRNVAALTSENVDGVIALADPEEAIGEAFAAEAAKGIDVVIDYLWGRPTELLLAALAKGFKPSGTRSTRLVEVGESAGSTIALAGSILRSVDVRLLGSGFGSASMASILKAIPELFQMAAAGKFHVDTEAVPLAEVEAAWSRVEKGRRIVFTL
jgi:NADPH:quinone reductase-like Zn-dependent oxidoreductase